jgi:hypothetical protein
LGGPGDRAKIQIVGSGFNAPVGAFDLTVRFDWFTLIPAGYVFGNSLGDPGRCGFLTCFGPEAVTVITETDPGIELTEVSLLSASALQVLQQGSFEFGSIYLALNQRSGGSLVTITGTVSDAAGNPINVTFGQTFVGSVPEPSTCLLSLLGLVAIARVYARQTQKG